MRASGRLRPALVRERDGDQEHDHNESDRISIKLFPIDVDTHRTALLFAEATMNNKPQCAAAARSKFVSGNPQGSTIPSAPDRRHFNARRRSVRYGGLRPPCHSLQKKAFRRLSRISRATMVKRMITTKAIAAPSSCFLSVWIRICSTPLCGSCKIDMP